MHNNVFITSGMKWKISTMKTLDISYNKCYVWKSIFLSLEQIPYFIYLGFKNIRKMFTYSFLVHNISYRIRMEIVLVGKQKRSSRKQNNCICSTGMPVAPKIWAGLTLVTLKFCKGLFLGWISKDPLSISGVSGQVLYAKQETRNSRLVAKLSVTTAKFLKEQLRKLWCPY